MTHVTIPNRPSPKDNRDINAILANFDAITKVINGELSADNIENEGVTGSKIAAAGIEDKHIAPGAQLMDTGGKYSARAVFVNGEEREPHPTRFAFVIAECLRASNTPVTHELFIGGVLVGITRQSGAGEEARGPLLSFLVPPKTKWHIVSTGTGTGSLTFSQLIL